MDVEIILVTDRQSGDAPLD